MQAIYDETLTLSKKVFYILIFILSNDIPLSTSNFLKKMLKSDREMEGNYMKLVVMIDSNFQWCHISRCEIQVFSEYLLSFLSKIQA